MLRHDAQPPALLPILARGKHRNPRKGACFMELASLLAGERFTGGVRASEKAFRRQAAPIIVRDAVEGIAHACVPDPDGMLRDLLVQAIAECAAWTGREPGRDAGELTLAGLRA